MAVAADLPIFLIPNTYSGFAPSCPKIDMPDRALPAGSGVAAINVGAADHERSPNPTMSPDRARYALAMQGGCSAPVRCPVVLPANGPIVIEFLLPQRLGGRKIAPNGLGIWGMSVKDRSNWTST